MPTTAVFELLFGQLVSAVAAFETLLDSIRTWNNMKGIINSQCVFSFVIDLCVPVSLQTMTEDDVTQ